MALSFPDQEHKLLYMSLLLKGNTKVFSSTFRNTFYQIHSYMSLFLEEPCVRTLMSIYHSIVHMTETHSEQLHMSRKENS